MCRMMTPGFQSEIELRPLCHRLVISGFVSASQTASVFA